MYQLSRDSLQQYLFSVFFHTVFQNTQHRQRSLIYLMLIMKNVQKKALNIELILFKTLRKNSTKISLKTGKDLYGKNPDFLCQNSEIQKPPSPLLSDTCQSDITEN